MTSPVPDLTEVPDQSKRVYVVSYPNSERTWLRVMLSRYKQLLVGFAAFQVKLHAHYSESPASPQYIFYHAKSDERPLCTLWNRLRRVKPVYPLDLSTCDGSKVIFLVRDPRDVVVSNYFEVAKRQKRFTGSLSAFIRDPWFGVDRVIHFCNHIHKHSRRTGACLFVVYENMLVQPELTVRNVCEFSDAVIVNELLRESVRFASLENMKVLEQENALVRQVDGRTNKDSQFRKARKGKAGGYVDELSTEDVAFLDRKLRAGLVAFFHEKPFEWVRNSSSTS